MKDFPCGASGSKDASSLLNAMTCFENILYTCRTRTTGTREGSARSDDGRLDVQLTPPGAPGSGTNPEQLLAAAWSADFLSTLRRAASAHQIAWPENSSIDAQIDLVHDLHGFLLRARFTLSLPELDAEAAWLLIEAARQNSAYSRAMRGNVDMEISLA